jgi:hypothetical protein
MFRKMLIYALNNSVSDALKHFNLEIKKLDNSDLADRMSINNAEVISLISLFDPEKLYISITSSDSVFYRFKLYDSPFEFKWNVFVNANEEENSTLIIYKNSIKQNSYYGSVYELYDAINNVLNEAPEYSFEIYRTDILSPQIYGGKLSHVLNTL